MAIKKESGGSKKPVAKMAVKGQANRSMTKMASKAKPKTVSVDPSSAITSINAAKKKMTNGDATTDYEVSRAADAYAKALRKYGVKITPSTWGRYKPGPGSNAAGVANKPKGSLKSTAKPKAPRGR